MDLQGSWWEKSLLANTSREDDESRMSLAPNPNGNENECLANSWWEILYNVYIGQTMLKSTATSHRKTTFWRKYTIPPMTCPCLRKSTQNLNKLPHLNTWISVFRQEATEDHARGHEGDTGQPVDSSGQPASPPQTTARGQGNWGRDHTLREMRERTHQMQNAGFIRILDRPKKKPTKNAKKLKIIRETWILTAYLIILGTTTNFYKFDNYRILAFKRSLYLRGRESGWGIDEAKSAMNWYVLIYCVFCLLSGMSKFLTIKRFSKWRWK